MPDFALRQLEIRAPLTEEERGAVFASLLERRDVPPEADLTELSRQAGGATVLLRGFGYSFKEVSGSRRQIVAIHMPGEICALQSCLLEMDHRIRALTACEIGLLAHGTIAGWLERYPGLALGLWRSCLLHLSVSGEWLASIGRRTSEQRVAHLLCEMVVRLNAIGLVSDRTCVLPLTQLHIADAVGLTSVHVSRVLDRLRRDGMVERRRQSLHVLDWDGLKAAGDFDPGYLHLPEGLGELSKKRS